MKLSYRFSIFISLVFVLLVFSWITEKIESISPISGVTVGKHIPVVRAKARSIAAQTPPPTPAITQTPPEAVPVTAPTTFPFERFLLERIPEGLVEGGLSTPALAYLTHSEGLHGFIDQVVNEQGEELRGVYVEDILALPVVQQPEGDIAFVDSMLGTVTQFQSAALHGVTGLLAHNFLSGELFFNLEKDQVVNLIYGDGMVKRYLVTDIQSFKKLAGDLKNSHYLSLESGDQLSTPELFQRVYTGGDQVTFQTCIKKGNDWSWGRLFIIATPLLEN